MAARVMRDSMGDRANLKKTLADLAHIIEYTPGCGSGNFSCFRFLALDFNASTKVVKGVEKGVVFAPEKVVEKVVISRPLIRKEDLNQDQSQKLNSALVDPQRISGRIPAISSSAKADDDIEVKSSDLETVLKAYRGSPVCSGKTNASDEATAIGWLTRSQDDGGPPWRAKEIVNGIVVGTARRLGTMLDTGKDEPEHSPCALLESELRMSVWFAPDGLLNGN